MNLEQLVKKFDLRPHPEGGFFRETYRAGGEVTTPNGQRHYSTAIYYLLPKGAKSHLHRIRSDEVWHFYLGAPLSLWQIAPSGRTSQITLGQDIAAGHRFQHVVPAGDWFGAMPADGGEFSLVGCTVAPGFDFADFEIGTRANLSALFPNARDIVELLT